MRAMIFAAGRGTRMGALTLKRPKALMTVAGKPMLQWVTEKLIAAGVTTIVVNTHHHAEMLVEYIYELDYPGVHFYISDERNRLLDTGGGLKKAAALLDSNDPFFVHNVDVISDIDLKHMLDLHKSQRPLVTLAVAERMSSRTFLWSDNQLTGWVNKSSGERVLCGNPTLDSVKEMAFSGIQIVEPRIFPLITESGSFSIRDLYLRLAKNHRIIPYVHDGRFWADIGTPEKLNDAEKMVNTFRAKF